MQYEEIDLKPYVFAVLRHWRLIAAAGIVGALVAALVSVSLPKTYTATASVLVAIRQTESQVGLNQTVLEIETIDPSTRRQGLIVLAQSEAIEARLDPAALAQIVERNYKPGMLIDRDQVEVRASGDMIQILATADTPVKAQALANLWTTTFVDYSQQLYDDNFSNVQVVGEALLPYQPSGPATLTHVALGSALGLVLGTIAALILGLTGARVPFSLRRSSAKQSRDYPTPVDRTTPVS
jgi:uncharacterized protein involved in exopolysaccharide biosynthesis